MPKKWARLRNAAIMYLVNNYMPEGWAWKDDDDIPEDCGDDEEDDEGD